MKIKSSKRWKALSAICVLIGISVWVPNIVFEYGYGYWLLTFIINPLGILSGYFGRSRLLIIFNMIMTFSFFIFMFVGYLINAMIGGHP
ncbi:hypothetical protein [Salipaludibacillus daqingensis]|uniref:hypothetical protein n=1 Tax=Salipaludibacillus daqingensis TaxID=3041001 RepID=UPI00247623EA|nr:hypothetical protein [Salipaludibacillus daqingensis]